jgi:putative methionine-R-sulfoxide reductase with GAF domain
MRAPAVGAPRPAPVAVAPVAVAPVAVTPVAVTPVAVTPVAVTPVAVAPVSVAAQPANLPVADAPSRDKRADVRLVRAFHDASRVYSSVRTREDAMRAFLELAMTQVPSEGAAIMLADIDAHDMVIATTLGEGAQLMHGLRVAFGEGVAGHAVLYNLGLAVNDVQNDFRYDASSAEALGLAPRAILAAPIDKDGRAYGAIHLVNPRGNPRYSDSDMEIVTHLAHRLGAVMDRLTALQP